MGKTLLMIIVCTDYCNSRKKLKIVVSNGCISQKHCWRTSFSPTIAIVGKFENSHFQWLHVKRNIGSSRWQIFFVKNIFWIKHRKKLFRLFHRSPRSFAEHWDPFSFFIFIIIINIQAKWKNSCVILWQFIQFLVSAHKNCER